MSTNMIHALGPFIQEEYKANSALIYPGFLVEVGTDGDLIPHATEGGVAEAMFAMEDTLQGNTVSTIYADNAIVTCVLPGKGTAIYALVEAGQALSIGDKLMSRGNGKLVKVRDLDSGGRFNEEYNVAVALEALSVSASDTLIKVRIL